MGTVPTSASPTPNQFTYTLFLEVNESSPTGQFVRIADLDNFWANVRQGDQVRFVLGAAVVSNVKAIQVAFKPVKDLTQPEGPIGDWSTQITDQDFHTVTCPTRDFMAQPWLVTNDGLSHECENGGHTACGGKTPCP